jgi:hypothetical protein
MLNINYEEKIVKVNLTGLLNTSSIKIAKTCQVSWASIMLNINYEEKIVKVNLTGLKPTYISKLLGFCENIQMRNGQVSQVGFLKILFIYFHYCIRTY